MTILETFLQSIKIKPSIEKADPYKQDLSSKTSSGDFSRILDSASKSYDYTQENRMDRFSEKDLYGKNNNYFGSNTNYTTEPKTDYTSQVKDYSTEKSWQTQEKEAKTTDYTKTADSRKEEFAPTDKNRAETNQNINSSTGNQQKAEKQQNSSKENSHNNQAPKEDSKETKTTEKNQKKSNETKETENKTETNKTDLNAQLAAALSEERAKSMTIHQNQASGSSKQKSDAKQAARVSQKDTKAQIETKQVQNQDAGTGIEKNQANNPHAIKSGTKNNTAYEQTKTQTATKQKEAASGQAQHEQKADNNARSGQPPLPMVYGQGESNGKNGQINVAIPENLLNQNHSNTTNAKSKTGQAKSVDRLERLDDTKPVVTKLEVGSKNSESSQKDMQHQNEAKLNLANHLGNQDGSVAKTGSDKIAQFDKIMQANDPRKAENESIVDQVIKKASSELSANKSQVTIALNPDNLGKVEINLVTVKGVLTAQITAENNQVKDALNQSLDNLKQNLEDQGINVSQLVVQVQETNQTSNNTNQQNSHFEQNQQKFDNTGYNSSNSSFGNSERNDQGYTNTGNKEFGEEQSGIMEENPSKTYEGKVDYKV